MKVQTKFQMGSRVFFDGIENFNPKDNDELCIMDTWEVKGMNSFRAKLKGKDIFFYKNLTKDEFIEDAFVSKLPMKIGKFLVKNFAEWLGMTLEDLKRCKPLVDALDDKHKYEKIIYDAYLLNGSWSLTPEQKKKAYEEYKKYR